MKKITAKTIVFLLAAVLGVMMLASCGSSGSGSSENTGKESKTLAALKEKGKIVVGSSNDAPFAYIDVTNDKFSGIDADIMREIASRLGIKDVEMKIVEWDSLILELNGGSIDIIADAMYITETRKKQIYFSDVWYKEADAVIIPADSSYKIMEDLKDCVVAAQTGSEFLTTVEGWKEKGMIKDVAMYAEPDELLLAVNTGKVDACLVDDIIAYYIIENNKSLALKLLPGYESEDEGMIGAAVQKKDPEFLAEINNALNAMKEDGTLKKILDGYGLSVNFVGIEEGKTTNLD
ncbi:MAG: amino acid ABC transporter substrate-binding protein [Lachnospiraceae bacterium]|nr:amino acid ABC transporter substrate-binding protein [Lachnospiraceae bacterium]